MKLKIPIALSLALAILGPTSAQDLPDKPSPLTAEERARIREVLAQADQVGVAAPEARAAEPRAGLEQRAPLVRTSLYLGRGEREGHRIVETLQFSYREGVTLRRTLDLNEPGGKLIEEERLEAYPTPLAPEEKRAAVKLAFEQVEELRLLAGRHGKPREIVPMTPTNADRKSPTFRHRLTNLNFTFGGGDGQVRHRVRVEVNLTTRKARLLVAPPADGALRAADDAEGLALDPAAIDPDLLMPPEPETAPGRDARHTIESEFPVNAAPGSQRSAWRVEFSVINVGSDPDDETDFGSEILAVHKAEYRPAGDARWVTVLGPTYLAEMFVPYANGHTAYYDITGFDFQLLDLPETVLGPECVGPGQIIGDVVAVELHDSNPLWLGMGDPAALTESHRGERMEIWSALGAGNYTYIQFFAFHDDGTVELRSGATAHNHDDGKSDASTHFHTACWRLQFDLDAPSAVAVSRVDYETSRLLGAKGRTVVESFNGGMEGGIVWNPERFTQLRAESTVTKNTHDPQSYVSYDILPQFFGLSRNYGAGQEWTDRDLWVTRPTSPGGEPRHRFRELPNFIESPLPLDGEAKAIWVKSALVHRARDEDFGAVGYDSGQGVATTAWTSLILKPRNVSPKTPFYP